MNNGSASGATLANWRLSPWSCWAFHNVSQLIPVAPIANDPARTTPLPKSTLGLGGFSFTGPDGTRWDIARFLAATARIHDLVLVTADRRILAAKPCRLLANR